MMKFLSRFVVGGVLMAGICSSVLAPFSQAEERNRNISSLSQLAAPELSQAVQNAGKNHMPYLPVKIMTESKTEKLRSGIALPVYSNSFPKEIAQVRTQNWDQ